MRMTICVIAYKMSHISKSKENVWKILHMVAGNKKGSLNALTE
jgi:hypothetical protein